MIRIYFLNVLQFVTSQPCSYIFSVKAYYIIFEIPRKQPKVATHKSRFFYNHSPLRKGIFFIGNSQLHTVCNCITDCSLSVPPNCYCIKNIPFFKGYSTIQYEHSEHQELVKTLSSKGNNGFTIIYQCLENGHGGDVFSFIAGGGDVVEIRKKGGIGAEKKDNIITDGIRYVQVLFGEELEETFMQSNS